GVISDVMVVVLPSSSSLRLPEFRHLHASDAKSFLSGGGFLKVSFTSLNPYFLVIYMMNWKI
ncbi:protein kinase, partial [Trifolium medium]|nr:protein kinase [Trifolium medium]